MLHILFAVLGISLVIFVHEFGHFMFARLCGVRVETFSIGMGPKMFGWTRGDTTYQVAVLPLGGYVKMAGDELVDPEDPDAPAREPRPDELHGKSVGQRFLIFSGGVIMNVVFGLVVFPIVFLVGVPFTAPVIGAPTPGMPAWHAGLEAGTEILAVNGSEVFAFDHIPTAVALAEPGGLELTVRRPGTSQEEVIELTPRTDSTLGISVIGIGPNFEPELPMVVEPGQAAELAGVRDGDLLREVRGALPGQNPVVALGDRHARGLELELLVETPGEAPRRVTLPAELQESETPAFGILANTRLVADIRAGSSAIVHGLRVDDRITKVAGRPIALPHDLRAALAAGLGQEVTVEVEREGAPLTLTLPPMDEAAAARLAGDLALTADMGSPRFHVLAGGSSERAGLWSDDRVVRIDGASVESYQDIVVAARAASSATPPRSLTFTVLRQEEPGGPLVSTDIRVTPGPLVQPTPLGINFRPHGIVYRADGPIHALEAGATSTWRFLEDSWVFLQRIISQDVSAKNAGGIITIGMVSSHWAAEGLAKLFFFLCILSMNLAFLNILPVPLLDGGHLFFLLIEKLKGSPVSPRIQVMSQAIGLLMLLSLMVYVTYNDVVRWFFP